MSFFYELGFLKENTKAGPVIVADFYPGLPVLEPVPETEMITRIVELLNKGGNIQKDISGEKT